jgi:hypothetical protein
MYVLADIFTVDSMQTLKGKTRFMVDLTQSYENARFDLWILLSVNKQHRSTRLYS